MVSDRKIIHTDAKVFYTDTFDDINWDSVHGAVLESGEMHQFDIITPSEEYGIPFESIPSSGCGISRNFTFSKFDNIVFNLKVDRLNNFPSDVVLTFQVRRS